MLLWCNMFLLLLFIYLSGNLRQFVRQFSLHCNKVNHLRPVVSNNILLTFYLCYKKLEIKHCCGIKGCFLDQGIQLQ